MAPALRQVQWLPKFKPEMPRRYDGAADPSAFQLAYEEACCSFPIGPVAALAAGGGE